MNKKPAKKNHEPSAKIMWLKTELDFGNYFLARNSAHQLLLASDATPSERDFAHFA